MEIEVKAKLKNRTAVMEKMAELGCQFSDVKTQDDMVWVEKTGSLEDFLSNKVFLRIRIQNGEKVIMTAKSPKAKHGDESLVKREHEVVVSSADEARNILSMLGLQEAVRVVKKRQTAKYEGYEICMDEIENLGSFIELEKMAEEKDAAQIQKDMFEFLGTLGILPEDQVKKGYDILMLERK
jgi:adenylate cyclase, class 2